MTRHATPCSGTRQKKLAPPTHIDIPGWGTAEIDAEFVPVITELNKVGLKTRQCCQGDGGQYS